MDPGGVLIKFNEYILSLQMIINEVITSDNDKTAIQNLVIDNNTQKKGAVFSLDKLVKSTVALIQTASDGVEEISIGEIDTPLKYAFTAWADEIFIKSFRDFMDYNISGIVEYNLYGTRESGEKIFEHMNYVLDNEIKSGLAEVYRRMIILGYRGFLYQSNDGIEDQNIINLYNDFNSLCSGLRADIAKPKNIDLTIPNVRKNRINKGLLLYSLISLVIIFSSSWLLNLSINKSNKDLERIANFLLLQNLDFAREYDK